MPKIMSELQTIAYTTLISASVCVVLGGLMWAICSCMQARAKSAARARFAVFRKRPKFERNEPTGNVFLASTEIRVVASDSAPAFLCSVDNPLTNAPSKDVTLQSQMSEAFAADDIWLNASERLYIGGEPEASPFHTVDGEGELYFAMVATWTVENDRPLYAYCEALRFLERNWNAERQLTGTYLTPGILAGITKEDGSVVGCCCCGSWLTQVQYRDFSRKIEAWYADKVMLDLAHWQDMYAKQWRKRRAQNPAEEVDARANNASDDNPDNTEVEKKGKSIGDYCADLLLGAGPQFDAALHQLSRDNRVRVWKRKSYVGSEISKSIADVGPIALELQCLWGDQGKAALLIAPHAGPSDDFDHYKTNLYLSASGALGVIGSHKMGVDLDDKLAWRKNKDKRSAKKKQ